MQYVHDDGVVNEIVSALFFSLHIVNPVGTSCFPHSLVGSSQTNQIWVEFCKGRRNKERDILIKCSFLSHSNQYGVDYSQTSAACDSICVDFWASRTHNSI